MHDIEPFWNWRHKYTAEEDERSPFFGEDHSEFEFTNAVYDHVIHPQWDNFGSTHPVHEAALRRPRRRLRHHRADRRVERPAAQRHHAVQAEHHRTPDGQGINKFILIGENVLNFHTSDEEYYAEWFEEVSDADGWIALLNFRPHVLEDMQSANIDQYFLLGGKLNALKWRTQEPETVFEVVEGFVMRRLGV
jgi:hypothetical protein